MIYRILRKIKAWKRKLSTDPWQHVLYPSMRYKRFRVHKGIIDYVMFNMLTLEMGSTAWMSSFSISSLVLTLCSCGGSSVVDAELDVDEVLADQLMRAEPRPDSPSEPSASSLSAPTSTNQVRTSSHPGPAAPLSSTSLYNTEINYPNAHVNH